MLHPDSYPELLNILGKPLSALSAFVYFCFNIHLLVVRLTLVANTSG